MDNKTTIGLVNRTTAKPSSGAIRCLAAKPYIAAGIPQGRPHRACIPPERDAGIWRKKKKTTSL
ncbi:hypothetical protein CCM_00550 [Cordyceps militaris CM01]|uniref:Uncharacterized protein n=1 Tax=Cordyceps militaris (strain CM01) TaxID=983644 RepID=G3J4S9_CORMM|nr:uncharacterized protein CCM_00550 [Cordyceps militaris CM01]EGX95896.1 hypothetical protein CCM_00550 [Cordyceps militaris CM01]